MLKNIAGEYIVVPLGVKNFNFNAMITLNESGAFLWKCLEKETTEADLLCAMLQEYDVDEVKAKADLMKFIDKLKDSKILE